MNFSAPKTHAGRQINENILDFLWAGNLSAGNADRQQVNLAGQNRSAMKLGSPAKLWRGRIKPEFAEKLRDRRGHPFLILH
jgi:hypothetical protein